MVTFGSVAYLETSAFKDLPVRSGAEGSFFDLQGSPVNQKSPPERILSYSKIAR